MHLTKNYHMVIGFIKLFFKPSLNKHNLIDTSIFMCSQLKNMYGSYMFESEI